MPSHFLKLETGSPSDFEEKIQLKILNSLIILSLSINLFFVFYNSFITKYYSTSILQACFFLLSLVAMALQAKQKYSAAKTLIFLLLNVEIFIASMFLRPGRGVEYFYIIVLVFYIILYSNTKLLYFFFILDIFLFLAPQIFIHPYPEEYYSYINIIALVITLIVALQYFIITQNRYKELLRTQKQKLESLNAEKTDLISIAAHDLKTPLAQIKGLISILEIESTQLTDEQKQLIEKIKGVTENQNKQITGYLKNQSLEDSIETSTLIEINVKQMLKTVLEEIKPLADEKNIRIKNTSDNSNPNIEGNEEGFYKVLSNLLSNAVKFSEENKEVHVDVKSDQRQVLISIKDQGPGFKEEEMSYVFKKNSVLSASPTGSETSSGLGLYIVKRYVDRMSGWIWLDSKEGEGSTFYIKVPRI